MNDSQRDELLLRMDGKLNAIQNDVGELREVTFGDGGDDKPGLRVRVDRMEQRNKLVAWVIAAVGTFGISAFCELCWRKLTGH